MSEEQNHQQPHTPSPKDIGRIATVEEFINSVLGDDASERHATQHQAEGRAPMPTSPPAILSAEEYARQQDIAARLRGESHPHFD